MALLLPWEFLKDPWEFLKDRRSDDRVYSGVGFGTDLGSREYPVIGLKELIVGLHNFSFEN
jgi:hypothetical protein